MKIRIAGIVDDSIVDGEGVRLTVFTQGCPHHCHGCHNPQTWNLDGGHEIDTEEIVEKLKENPLLSGITFSGGEPFLQPAPLAEIARAAHKLGLDVWSYTGFTLEELKKRTDAQQLLNEVDVLVDGPYVEALRDLTLRFRGSSNQRIIDLKELRKGRVA